jgi:hypothetical protein
MLAGLFGAALLALSTFTADDTHQAVWDAAANHGVSYGRLRAIVACETGNTFNPRAVGDYRGGRPTSLGAVQLNTLPSGLYWDFVTRGYDDAFDPYQATDYLARVMTGEFAREGITVRRWTCAT